MAKWAVINKLGEVVNCVEWDGPSTEWLPPRGHYIVQSDIVKIGDQYDFNLKKIIPMTPIEIKE